MAIYFLVVIVVMMLTAIVVTRERDEDSELTKVARKRRGVGYVSPGRERSLAPTSAAPQK